MPTKTPPPTLPSRRLVLAAGAGLLAARSATAQTPSVGPPAAKPADGPAAKAEVAGAKAEAPRVLGAASLKVRIKPAPAAETETWAFDGVGGGPVLRLRHGEAVALRFENRTNKPLALHWHGVRSQNAMDGVGGVTQKPVEPGAAFEVRFTPPDAGTYLIRPLVVGGAGEPAGRGLAGLLVVEERTPPVVDRDVPLLFQDWRLEDDGALSPFGQTIFAATAGRLGNALTVNGRPTPERIEAAPGARLRLRLANACSARATRLRFDGVKVYVAAIDGQPTDTFEPLRATLPFPPGTRYDLLLDLPAQAGESGTVTALIGAAGMPLATLVAAGAPLPARPRIAPIGENKLLPAEIRLERAFRRDLVITGGAPAADPNAKAEPSYTGDAKRIWMVNGASGTAEAPPAFSVKRGTSVVLALTNKTAHPQALHLHGHVFRLLHPLDDGWEPYWLDTFQLLEGRTARIAFLADNPGRWLVSSSVLDRFDTGLWTSFEVT